MSVHDLFGSNSHRSDLPSPTAEMRTSDDEGDFTPEQARGIVGNPIYAGIGPYPPLVDDNTWVRAAAQLIETEGKEQFLVNLLSLLRRSFAEVPLSASAEVPLSASPADDTSAPLLTIHNHHSENCGSPPRLDDSSHEQYIGYFENPFGEQWLFTFDRTTRQATLRGGDIHWDRVCRVDGGRAEGIVLGPEEQTWLAACWRAATV